MRAFLKVQDGCQAGCAYCIIPRLRGKERHRDYREALAEAEALLRMGIQEIVLTGVRLGSYRGHPRGLAGLVEDLHHLGAKVRLSSIEPEDTGRISLGSSPGMPLGSGPTCTFPCRRARTAS